jgi:DNA sulfur modification protein DndD
MRIEKIVLQNYRQFREAEIPFRTGTGGDLHVVIGSNGTGKTNILNAFNWCLYGDEPHLSRESQQLTRLNLNAILNSVPSKLSNVSVDIWAKTDSGQEVVFRRRMAYKTYSDTTPPSPQGSSLEVEITDELNNTIFLEDDDAIVYVDRFVPKRIREFFFFDGERLDRYFKEATSKNIRLAIFEISQIDLLDKIERRLNDTLRELRREAGKKAPTIETIRLELEKGENLFAELEKQFRESLDQVTVAKENIREREDKLRDLPDTEALEREREGLQNSRKTKRQLHGAKIAERQDLLFEYSKSLMLLNVVNGAIRTIENKRANKELPPTDDKNLLETILRTKFCSICGRQLDDESEKKLGSLIREIRLSSEVSNELLRMEEPLHVKSQGNSPPQGRR